MRSYLRSNLVALSVLLNSLTGGDGPETMSYRAAKARRSGKCWGCLLCRLLDRLDPDHCERTIGWWERK